MTYFYRCPVCGHRETHEHSIKHDPEYRCARTVTGGARCGAKLKRIIAGGGAVLFPMSSRKNGIT